jgi:hypothetical protein
VALQAELNQLAAELKRAEAAPPQAAELREKVGGALDVLRQLDMASAAAEPDLLREVLAEVVAKIKVWFSHKPYGQRVRCRFAQAVVWVREDVALVCTNVTFFKKLLDNSDTPS